MYLPLPVLRYIYGPLVAIYGTPVSRICIRENWSCSVDTNRANLISHEYLKSNNARISLNTSQTFGHKTKFSEMWSVLFTFAVLSGVYCSNNLDGISVEAGENVDYQVYQDLDVLLSADCEEHEEYSECSGTPTCQKTCGNMDKWDTMACTKMKLCIRGCICEDGYVRDDYNGVCVRENSCPRVRH